MSDLIDWYRAKEREGEHPIVIAATFHYRFVRIHPFDDGNGRMARLLMNMILIKHGYTVAMIRRENRDEYLSKLEQTDRTEDLTEFINYIAGCCEYALDLYLRAARGEPIDDIEDIDKEIALFKQSLAGATANAFPAREYIETILHPLWNYCSDKSLQFSDVFSHVSGHISLDGTTTDGKTIKSKLIGIGDDGGAPQNQLGLDDLPAQLRSLSATINIRLFDFQGMRNVDNWIVIENSCDTNHCKWEFRSRRPRKTWEHEGRDLEELKRQFNRLLREMMKALDQNSS